MRTLQLWCMQVKSFRCCCYRLAVPWHGCLAKPERWPLACAAPRLAGLPRRLAVRATSLQDHVASARASNVGRLGSVSAFKAANSGAQAATDSSVAAPAITSEAAVARVQDGGAGSSSGTANTEAAHTAAEAVSAPDADQADRGHREEASAARRSHADSPETTAHQAEAAIGYKRTDSSDAGACRCARQEHGHVSTDT